MTKTKPTDEMQTNTVTALPSKEITVSNLFWQSSQFDNPVDPDYPINADNPDNLDHVLLIEWLN